MCRMQTNQTFAGVNCELFYNVGVVVAPPGTAKIFRQDYFCTGKRHCHCGRLKIVHARRPGVDDINTFQESVTYSTLK